ncbi:proteasome subunit beta [candidate division KSB3 bacterium]|uniref:Proteasome subunit beta n=1 Tax=candidate division KSB3 bacterium TaxID=2044937 RepID=A0A9D5JVV4_9BACT|nr:proteasome subunit beta [candidate division KSB3 bacterium]MBD3325090.1 proteasome subunit beta [candidate division KSB3 bacterium]
MTSWKKTPKSSSKATSNEEENNVIFPTRYQGTSFVELLQTDHQHLLTRFTELPDHQHSNPIALPMATTILAVCYDNGVLIGGDRRAVEGNRIASRRIEKVYKTDQFSAMAVAGVAGLCIDMAKLFRTELEHYEKIEGEQLVVDGKANKLAHMIRQNFPAALQGLVVVPIFVGYDIYQQRGRIFRYDVIGGMYEEDQYYATGSGGKDARNTLKKIYHPPLDQATALRLTIEALHDAAEEDAATGGPDMRRGVYPSLKTVTAQGVQDLAQDRIESVYQAFLDEKFQP